MLDGASTFPQVAKHFQLWFSNKNKNVFNENFLNIWLKTKLQSKPHSIEIQLFSAYLNTYILF